MKSFKFPLVESEEEYYELCRTANIPHRKHGRSVEFYMDCLREDPFDEMALTLEEINKIKYGKRTTN